MTRQKIKIMTVLALGLLLIGGTVYFCFSVKSKLEMEPLLKGKSVQEILKELVTSKGVLTPTSTKTSESQKGQPPSTRKRPPEELPSAWGAPSEAPPSGIERQPTSRKDAYDLLLQRRGININPRKGVDQRGGISL